MAEISSAARFHFILTCFSNLPATVFKEKGAFQGTSESHGLKKASARSPPADVRISLTTGHGAQHCLPPPSAVLQAYFSLTLRINEPWKQGKDKTQQPTRKTETLYERRQTQTGIKRL